MEKRKVGDRFKEIGGTEYILAQVNYNKVALICLVTGNRFTNPVRVENPDAISEEEWNEITDNKSDEFISIPKLEPKKQEATKAIGRSAKVHYQKTADGKNKVVKLEGFLTENEIKETSQEVYRLWRLQEHRMYSQGDNIWINKSCFNLVLEEVHENVSFETIISEMKTCGKVLAKIIKDVKEAEEKEIKVISI